MLPTVAFSTILIVRENGPLGETTVLLKFKCTNKKQHPTHLTLMLGELKMAWETESATVVAVLLTSEK
jgi:hypothetical protein